MNNFLNVNLANLGVHDLREIARRFSIKAPTVLRKEQLLEKIMQAIKSGTIYNEEIFGKGRKPKINSTVGVKLDIPLDLKLLPKFKFSNNDFRLIPDTSTALTLQSTDNLIKETTIAVGILQKTENQGNYYFYSISETTCKIQNLVYVSDPFIAQYSLRIGDKIKGFVVESQNSDARVLTYLMDVNGSKAKRDAKRISSEDFEIIAPHKKNNFGVCEMLYGQRALCVVSGNNEDFDKFLKMCNTISSKFDELIVLGNELFVEQIAQAKNICNSSLFLSEYGDSFVCSCNATVTALEYAQSLLFEGKNICFCVYNVGIFAENLEQRLPQFESSNFFKEYTLIQLKKFFSIARCVKDGGSITSFIVCKNSELEIEYINKLFFKTANIVVKI